MNRPLRRLSIIVALMFVAIMASTTYHQFFNAQALNNDTRNVRALYREYGNDRGPILASNGQVLVESVPIDSPFAFMRTFSGGNAEQAAMYAPVTGYFSIVNGMTGIERAENDYLSGRAAALWVNRLRDIFTGEDTRGASVETTIVPAVQQTAWNALGNQRGAVVAYNPQTGAILAMVSKPSYNPNDLAIHSTAVAGQRYQDLINTEHDPLLNRNIATLYPPGSTFKLVTAAAALESGTVVDGQMIPAPVSYRLPGTTHNLNNFGGASCSPTGEMTLHEAMVISCNTAFAMLGVELGAQRLASQAQKFWFNNPFEIPMRTAASGFPPPQTLSPDRQALSGIGQGDVTATPLQMAVIAGAIGNGGVIMQPYLVQEIRDPSLETIYTATPRELTQAINSTTAEALKAMMIDTVNRGTGTGARIPGIEVAGKTGTAQTAAGVAPHAWFVAFAPADNPQVAVAVVVEQGGNLASEATGGRVAAPIARAVIEAALS